ncbi:hypothetical protein DAPPUDRAFT_329997 [Daphnia pulex]|uniref:Uncharacterized protein n=1 Tax=Daphnia pulex TaxID=6669 RepID=E9HI89_DAPPU|nr:hypothetical protein DAPPUDRAFT_329997 [Daphnia pulex]|eukprot:EFX68552.1 hypothetical protein DAPPUDRAFT_329997 [Daphnia pulex]
MRWNGACANLLFNEFVHQGLLPGVSELATWQAYAAYVISVAGAVSYGVRDQSASTFFFTNILRINGLANSSFFKAVQCPLGSVAERWLMVWRGVVSIVKLHVRVYIWCADHVLVVLLQPAVEREQVKLSCRFWKQSTFLVSSECTSFQQCNHLEMDGENVQRFRI